MPPGLLFVFHLEKMQHSRNITPPREQGTLHLPDLDREHEHATGVPRLQEYFFPLRPYSRTTPRTLAPRGGGRLLISEVTLYMEKSRDTTRTVLGSLGWRRGLQPRGFISQNAFIDWFSKVKSPTRSSNYCLLLPINILS